MASNDSRLNRLEGAEGDSEEVRAYYVSWAGEGEEEDPGAILTLVKGGKVLTRMTLAEYRRRYPEAEEKKIVVGWEDIEEDTSTFPPSPA